MSENNMAKKRKWTLGQSAAINTKNKTLLVSAAAGSGKTATLTERIIRSLTDKNNPSDISKMLIVTFTRAAATELKDRIFKALSTELCNDPTNKHLNDQLIKLVSANICTIDSFYLNLLRQNFSALGISASFRVAETSELNILKKSVMDDVIEEFYDADESFDSFAECFIGTRSIGKLSEPMITLSDNLASYPEGIEFLKIKAEELMLFAKNETDLFNTQYGRILAKEYISRFEYYESILNDACKYSIENSDAFSKRLLTYSHDREYISAILNALKKGENYETLTHLFSLYNFETIGRAKPSDETEESIFYKTQRKKIVEETRNIRARVFSRTSKAISSEMYETALYVSKLYSLISKYKKRMDEEKSRRNILDFDDIRRYTLKLLVNKDGSPTSVALSYREQFSDIYIDEYQDVDRVQDMIFSAISKNNRFMVGDIKQSIYGFRGAEPRVFADYRRSFDQLDPTVEGSCDNSDEITIFMSDNFRCDENVIKFTNLVCSRIFRASAESIGYTSADDLKFSKALPYDDYISPAVKISVIRSNALDDDDDTEGKKKKRKKSKDTPDSEELEAEYIAREIERLIKEEKNADGSPICAGDIAVLYRSNKMVSYISDALAKRGIMTSEGGGNEYFESPDVLLVLSILNVVDNPHRDIHLAAALCSPIFEFSMDELITIKLNASAEHSLYDALLLYSEKDDLLASKCSHFARDLDDLRRSSLSLPVDRFLRVLFESDAFVSSGLLSDKTDFGEGGNLLRLYDYARSFESGSFKGLYNFIEFINDLIENDQVLETAPKGRSNDRVNLSTMHHSKGLEFPVCFICGTGKRKNLQGLSKSLLYDKNGIAMKLSDSTGFARVNTPMREAIARSIFLCENEEEMRILYVAMTRARERLYIVATSKTEPEELLANAKAMLRYDNSFSILHCTSFLQWILLPIVDKSTDTSCCSLNFIDWDMNDADVLYTERSEDVKKEATQCINTELLETLKNKFSFSYPYKDLIRIPSKVSVSRLSPDFLDENDTSATLFQASKRKEIPAFFLSDKPQKASAADRGTATHLFLQFCDLSECREYGIDNELSRLVKMEFIPKNVADIIFTDELEKFTKSELAERMMSAKKIIREQRFNLLLHSNSFTKDMDFVDILDGETLAVQGVIDLLLIMDDGSIELYDYKTDRLSAAELADDFLAEKKMNQSHGLQLSYYAYAISRLFKKECSKIRVYSTHSAKLYDIKPIELKIEEIER